VASERDNQVFSENQVFSLVVSLIFKTVLGIFLTLLVCLKSVKSEMPGNFSRNTLIPNSKKLFGI
jgi:hypothetical protein